MILLSLMPPTTLISTPLCFLSYSATSSWNSISSVPALQPTQTVSFVAGCGRGAAVVPADRGDEHKHEEREHCRRSASHRNLLLGT